MAAPMKLKKRLFHLQQHSICRSSLSAWSLGVISIVQAKFQQPPSAAQPWSNLYGVDRHFFTEPNAKQFQWSGFFSPIHPLTCRHACSISVCSGNAPEAMPLQIDSSKKLLHSPVEAVDLELEEEEGSRSQRNVRQQRRPAKEPQGLGIVATVSKILRENEWSLDTRELLARCLEDVKPEHVPEILKRMKDIDIALNFFYWVGERSPSKLNSRTYSVMIGRLGIARKFDAMRQLLEEMRNEGIRVTTATYLALVRSYGR